MALRRVKCPKCDELVGRIVIGVSEFGCKPCRLRMLVSCDGNRIMFVLVDELPARPP